MERREKSKRWAPSEGADKALGLRLGTRLISIIRSRREICSFTDTYQSCPDEIQLGSEAASSDSDSDEVEPFEKNFDT